MAFRASVRRRVLAGGLAGCALLAVVDHTAPGITAPVRSAVGAVATPVQNALLGTDDEVARLTKERDRARQEAGDATANRRVLAQLKALQGAPATQGRRFVAARVVGYTSGAQAAVVEQVTIDAGRAQGLRPGLTVVSGGGLVGRTVAVDDTSSTVQLLTDPDSVVGVRVGSDGSLASLSSTVPSGLPKRPAGTLTLRMAGLGAVRTGDVVRTLGSVDEEPFVADVVVGKVVAVDPDRGQGARTAVVRPAVSMSRLDVVGVVLPNGKSVLRPQVEGSR